MSSMVLDGGMPRSRSTDPVTSVDAGRSVNLKGSQAAVYACMRDWDPGYGWTQQELEDEFPKWSPSRIRSAVSELEALGAVAATGFTRRTRYGREARVYRVVDG